MCSFRCFVTKVKDDSPAAGIVLPLVRVYSINGTDVTDKLKNDAVALIKAGGQALTFCISDGPDNVGYKAFADGGAAPAVQVDNAPAFAAVMDGGDLDNASAFAALMDGGNPPSTTPGPGRIEVTVNTGGGKLGMSIAGPRDEADPRKG